MIVPNETVALLFARAREMWPAVELPIEAFSRRLDALVSGDADPDASARGRATSDLYLAWACLEGVSGAHEAFDRAYLTQVPAWVTRIVRSAARADEVRQETARRLLTSEEGELPRLATYGGRGPLGGWVRIAATRVAQNIRQHQQSLRGVPFESELSAPDLDPEVAALRRIYAKEFADALRGTLRSLGRDERNILRLHYIDGLSIDDVGKAYRVSRATAARMLARAREGIVSKMQERLTGALGAVAPEPASVLALIRDELEESLARRLSE